MRKKSDKELGVVLPEGMVDTINNRDLTDAQVGKIIRAITWNSMEYAQDDIVAKQLTTSLIGTYRTQNRIRIARIKMVRGWKSESEKKRRERARLAEEKLLQEAGTTMDFHGTTMDFHGSPMDTHGTHIHVRTCETAENKKSEKERSKEKDKSTKDIPPIKSPHGGDKKSSSAKAEGHALTGSPTTRGRRPGQTVAKGRDGAGSTRPTAQTTTSGASRERPATSSKKTTGANLWDGAAVVVKAAEAMMARHPNSKSGKRAVEQAIVAAIADDDGDRMPPATVDAIDAAHAAWCATDGWAEDKGQFVQALAAWIRNGGWRKLPPQKKKPAPSKGDEISFDASL